MNEQRLLRALLVSDIALTVFAVPFAFIGDRLLPPALQAYATAESEAPLHARDLVFIVLALPLLITLVLAWIGLFRSWKVAPALYLIACIGNVVVLLVGGPTVEPALGTAADTASSMLSGLILGLVYFSGLRNRYARGAVAVTGGVAYISMNPSAGGGPAVDWRLRSPAEGYAERSHREH